MDAEGNIITDNGNEFTTTLTNKHYEPDSTDTDNKYQLFNRSNLPEEYRSYYFKTLRYTIGNLDGGTYAYHTGAGKAPYSAGTIWGYVTTDTVPAERPKHEMKVYQVSGEEKTELTALRKTTTVKIDAGTSVSYGIDGATLSSSKINAGDPVKIGGSIFVPSYPYTSNNCLNGIRLGFLLPDGMTVNEASIVATYKGGTLEVESVTSEIVGTNQTFWIVSFKEGNKIGHYNEKLEELDTGSRLNFSVQFNTDRTMSTQTLNLREFVFAAGAGIVNGSGGSYSDHACVDDYDLNGNGKTTDTVACYGVESTQSITIEAVPPQLEIEDELEIGGFTGSSLTMNSSEDVVYYKFDLKSTKGGRASGFYYLIPIANGILEEEEDFLVDQNNPEFKLALGGPVSVTHEAGTKIKVYYTTNQTINSYADALQLPDSEWFTDIPSTSTFSLAQEGTKWSDVTMIKIVADDPEHPDDPVIVNGSQNVISIPLVYDGNYALYKNYAGMKIQWKSRGYYGMELGYNGFSGTLSTEGCTVTINYVEAEPREITLTAAKNGTPVGAGAVNIDSFTLPEFILAQEYTIGEIKVTNVNLVDGSYNFAGASGSAANTDFRINVSVKDEAEQNAAVAIFAEGTFVGKLDENSAPTFTFSIQNADALSDIVTERYVELTLFGSNGVIVPVKIIIKRELAAAEDPKPAIVSGKLYLPMSDTTTVIKVSQDSAFTAQFITEGMIPANYFGRKVVFEKALEAGTQITMIDWTDANSPGYYHYTVRNSTTTSIMLTEFTTMGGDTKYVEPTNGEFVNEQLMFIIQLPKTGQKDIDNNMCLRKTKKPDTEGAEPTVEDSDKLSFSTKAKRTFSLNTNKTAAKVGEEFVLTYTSAIGDSLSDSRFTGRGLALVIGASAGYTVPAEARLVVGGEVYTLNSEGKFVVPLDAVQKGNGTRTVRFLSETAQSVKLSAELWASATGSTQKVLMGEQVAGPVTVAVTAGTMPSFKVSSMSDRLLYPQDLMSVLTVLYEQQNATKISVEVQMKDAAGYITQSGAVEAVDGKTEHSMGVFNLANMDGSVALKLSVNMRPGTYRILFTVTNQNGSIKVPYYFIVAE